MNPKKILLISTGIIILMAVLVFTIHAPIKHSPDLANATYSFYGDTFTMQGGQATVTQGHAFAPAATSSHQSSSPPLVPIGYTLAATSTDAQTAVAAVYRNFGADLEWTVLFVLTNQNDGALTQVASGVAYQQDARIELVSLNGNIITLTLLVVSPTDQQKPHYEQTLTQSKTLQFKVIGSKLVPVS